LCGVLAIAKNAIHVLLEDELFVHEDEESEDHSPEKLVAETAMLLLVASRVDARYRELQERVDEVATQLTPYARSSRILTGIAVNPAFALHYAAAHVCLARMGREDRDFDRVLEASLASSFAEARELLPFRQLEMEWLRDLWGSEKNALTKDPSLPSRSALGSALDVTSSRTNLYAFTHALGYLTDFGARRVVLPRLPAAVLADAEAALARSLEIDDYDLAAELLLAWPLLGEQWSPAATFGFKVLAKVDDEVGFLPSLSLDPTKYKSLVGSDRRRYTIREGYHTVYVMGFLCAAMLRPGSAPPEDIEDAANTGVSIKIHGVLGDRTQTPQWERAWSELRTSQQDALASFVASAGLYRAIARYRYADIPPILSLCLGADLPTTPMIVQAGDLLRRLAVLGDTLEAP
jgi:hypothetical protein